MSQANDLYRNLLRPAILHTFRAAGFQTMKPAVLDTLVNLAERHLVLLASTTAQHAWLSHNDPIPSITDVRMALSDCGVLVPLTDPAEEAWTERMRRPLSEMADIPKGGPQRMAAEKRKRDEQDTRDVRDFTNWLDSSQHREIKRVAGMIPDPSVPAIGVGGGVVQADDFLTSLKKKHSKAGDDSRLQGTVLGRPADDREIVVEGGPVAKVHDWRPRLEERSVNARREKDVPVEKENQAEKESAEQAEDGLPAKERIDTATSTVAAAG